MTRLVYCIIKLWWSLIQFVSCRDTLGIVISEEQLNSSNRPIVNGRSKSQSNGFDCGVFTIANIEDYILAQHLPIRQHFMKLFRCRYLFKIFKLGKDIGVFWTFSWIFEIYLSIISILFSLNAMVSYFSYSTSSLFC